MLFARLFGVVLFLSVGISACASTEETALLVGDVSQQELFATHLSFAQKFKSTRLSESEVSTINQWPENLAVSIYFGTWCHDSQREVPEMLYLLAKNPNIATKLIALDYQKSEPKGRATAHQVKFTPTFIFSLNNKEIGRIIERPKESLVADVSAMLVDNGF